MGDDNRTWDYIILVFVCVLSVALVYAVVDTAYSYTKPPPNKCVCDGLPDIPQCDKELWLRIKDGCP